MEVVVELPSLSDWLIHGQRLLEDHRVMLASKLKNMR